MKLLTSMLVALSMAMNSAPADLSKQTKPPEMIDAYILAYDAMYTGDKEPRKDYVILDMESIWFADTTCEERKKAMEHFKKYGVPVLNASLFKLEEIGLADKRGQLEINGDLLMITNVQSDDPDGIVVEGYKYYGPIAAHNYRIRLKIVNGGWKVAEVKLLGIS